jgi:RNA polymerase sigma factor (sigma-70 family)
VRSGDVASAAAFAALYERHHRDLYRYCRSILRDDHDAQDALQSTMTRAFAALRDERRDFELRPWLFRIAHNEAVTVLRRRRAAEPLDEQAAAAGSRRCAATSARCPSASGPRWCSASSAGSATSRSRGRSTRRHSSSSS